MKTALKDFFLSGVSESLAPAPGTQASLLVITNLSSTSLSFSWTNGNGANRLVLVKASSVVNSDPVDGTAYTANTVFGSGSQIGTGNYVVFNGSGNSVTITGLTANTFYHIRVYEYNGSGPTINYNVSSATSNPSYEPTFTTEYQAKETVALASPGTYTMSSLLWRRITNGVVARLKTELMWPDILFIMLGGQDGNEAFDDLLMLALIRCPRAGTITWSASSGFASNGTDGRFILMNPSVNLAGFQDNCCAFLNVVTHNTIGEFSCASLNFTIRPYVSGNADYRVNDGTSTSVANANSIGFYQAQRIDSATKKLWKNGVVLNTAAVASTGLDNMNMAWLARQTAGGGATSGFSTKVHNIFGLAKNSFNGKELTFSQIISAYNSQNLTFFGLV